ncbi:MAG: tetraacyldisaccharide 4'-kinase [Terriglobales bacterium]
MILQQPLSLMFAAGVGLRNRLYDSGGLKSRELTGAVVSIGNISVGGAGKTPFTILLGQLLLDRGVEFDILSRGYGRATSGVAVVDPNGLAQQFGDEPLLMARRLGVPVVVGEDRYAAGTESERMHGVHLHLLDDGFQHRRLKRQFDIVLITPEDLKDRLLPAGRLREPAAALRRADAVVVTSGVKLQDLPPEVKNVWTVQRGIKKMDTPSRPIVFCGIARPHRLLAQLRVSGIEPAAIEIYRDHHAYSEADVHNLLSLRDRNHSDGFITTEKDAVNLGPLCAQLHPLAVIAVEMKLDDPDRCLDTMLNTLKARGKHVA